MTVVLWVLFGLAGAGWASLVLLLVYVRAVPPNNEAAGLGFALASVVLFFAATPLSLPGGVAGVWLAARLDTPGLRIVVGIAGGIMLAVVTFVAFAWWSGRRPARLPPL